MPHIPGHIEEDQNIITTETLNNIEPAVDFVNPNPSLLFPVADLNVETQELQATPSEGEASSLIQEIQRLNIEEVGESVFRTQEEEKRGVEAIIQTQSDLSKRVKLLQAEALSIPLQFEKDFAGRASVGAIRGMSGAALRENTIEALRITALLEASRGDLTTALDLVDRAVAQKFDPIREEIRAKTTNLNLILSSPEFSRQDKNRAQKQIDAQNNRLREVAREEAKDLAIGQIAVDVAAKGGDAQLLRQIQAAPDDVEAQRLASAAGFGIQPDVVDPADQVKLDILKTQLATANLKLTEAQIAASGAVTGGVLERLTDDQRSAYFKLVDKYEASSKDFFKIRESFNRVIASAEDPSAAGDLALIFNFMKTLDPGSVVRESEFRTAAAAGSFLDRTYGFGLKLKEGQRLAPRQRQDFVIRSIKLFETAQQQQQLLNNTFEDRAVQFGIPGGSVTRAIDAVKSSSEFEGINVGELTEIDELLNEEIFNTEL